MSFPPLRPSRDSTPTNDPNISNSGSGRPRQSAWGLSASQSSSRRDLSSLDTSFTIFSPAPSSSSRQNNPSSNTNLNSPISGPFSSSSLRDTSVRLNSRNTASISASSSPFGGFQAGGQQQQLSTSQLLSSRSSTNTPSNNLHQASSAAASTSATSQGGGGAGGGSSGGGTARAFANTTTSGITSPTSSNFDRTLFNSTSSSSNQSSVLKISLTQLQLLLSTLSETHGKAKWESQVEAIRKLVRDHGTEAFQAYFKKLLNSSPQFSPPGKSRSVEGSAVYPLLVEEITQGSHNFDKARQIADAVDAADESNLRDLDLQSFLNQFKLDPIGKTILASAFTKVSRPELRTKASSILAAAYNSLLQTLANPASQEPDVSPDVLATAALRALLDLPDAARDGTEKAKIGQALVNRYSKLNRAIPQAIISAMALPELFESSSELAQEFMRLGPGSTVSADNIKEVLRRFGRVNINDQEIANAIILMVLNHQSDAATYKLDAFVQVLRDQYSNIINWNNVANYFDREFFTIDKSQFLVLYQALGPVAQDEKLDIEILWSSGKRWPSAQLASAISFVSLNASELDATTIPNLQTAFDPQEAADGSDEVRAMAESCLHDTMISVKAVEAIANALWDPNNSALLSNQDRHNAKNVITSKMALFVCSAASLPASTWSVSLQQFIERTVTQCLTKEQLHYEFILHILWKQDKNWLHTRLVQFHVEDPIKLPLLLEHAQEHGWLRELCTTITGLGIDLAAMAHKKGYIDIQEWAADKLTQSPAEFTKALTRFLDIKIQDELRIRHNAQPAPRTVSLAMKTIWAILDILEDQVADDGDELNLMERTCISAYPRLCNYGEGFDYVIEANGATTNTLSPNADAQMQEQYKKMYNGDLDVKTIIERLRECKTSEDGEKQDLFACMIHGLFDEYTCFNEYPLGPLSKTAVLFGGIINYRLVNNIALNVAQNMVLESVRNYPPDAPMYKFGLQALIAFHSRLAEFPQFCQKILQVHSLQGKETYARAQDIVQNQGMNGTADDEGIDDINSQFQAGQGFVDNDSLVPQFSSINVDPVPHGHLFEDPIEDIGDKILFFLNNVSSDNFNSKIKELVDVLEPKHYLWFARLIVDERAKSQPNYQELYLSILDELDDGLLWAGVMRESYASIRKVINADTTMKAPSERTNLKNLALWLGSLTIARDKPIKHKNIAFKELLLEGWETSRLPLVIPFTCEVLGQGVKSILFKPPNPWTMEIIGLLLELYDMPDLKIQLRFAIEILLANFGLPRKGEGMERGNDLKKRQQMFDTAPTDPMISDNLDMFDEMGIGALSKLPRSHFSPPPLPDLEDMLVLPPSSNLISQQVLRHLVHQAVRKSIEEIIGPVVERSITIATISTKSLVQKDFAQEGDESLVRQAFENMVKCLAGSLASVTSKEPLRMSMNTYIRTAAAELPEQPLPEGSILMCVNDNLDMACRIIQKQAEVRALSEIEPAIESEVTLRREHRLKYPNEPYRDTHTSHWATYIPEPYKQVAGGLNQQQMDIYQHFAQQARGPITVGNGSMDGNKQLPDVLQDFAVPAVPNLATPAEQPAIPHQGLPTQTQARLLPPSIASTRPPSQVNGFMDASTALSHIRECLRDMLQTCRNTPETTLRDLPSDSLIIQGFERVLDIFTSLNADVEPVAEQVIRDVCAALLNDEDVLLLDAQVLAATILAVLRVIPEGYSNRLIYHIKMAVVEHVQTRASVTVTAALLENGLLEYSKVDVILESAIQQGNIEAQRTFAGLLDILLFVPDPIVERPRFARCLAAIGELASNPEDNPIARSIVDKLNDFDAATETTLPAMNAEEREKREEHQMQHLYEQWYMTYAFTDGNTAFLLPLLAQVRNHFQAGNDMTKFVRHCIERAVQDFNEIEKTALRSRDQELVHHAYPRLDAVANLVVLAAKAQSNDAQTKPQILKSLLLIVVLILHSEQWRSSGTFNGKPFLRLLSTALYVWHTQFRDPVDDKLDNEIILAVSQIFNVLQPNQYPGFLYQWMSLLTHQAFLPALLKTGWKEGHETYANLLHIMLQYATSLVEPRHTSGFSRVLYRSALKMILLIHHDYPEFLADYHYQICNAIPPDFPHLRNIVLSATPASILDKPDPFTTGLKIDRLEEVKRAPNIAIDIAKILKDAGMKDGLDEALQASGKDDQPLEGLPADASFDKSTDGALMHAVVIYIAQKATAVTSSGSGPSFSMDGPYTTLVSRITKSLGVLGRFFFLSAVADQLRYPNSHTWFYISTLLHLFGKDGTSEQEIEIRHTITRIMLERAVLHRPHPWGVVVVFLELLKNNTYGFWAQPHVKGNLEIQNICDRLLLSRPESQYPMESITGMRNHN